MGDLEDHTHAGGERDTLVGREGQHLVVVHHRVHGLDPLRVDRWPAVAEKTGRTPSQTI